MENRIGRSHSNRKRLGWLVYIALVVVNVLACEQFSQPPDATLIVLPSSTPTSVLASPTPTLAPVKTVWANKTCWEKKPLDEAATKISGSLFYLDSQTNEYTVADLNTSEEKVVGVYENGDYVYGDVSPDGKWISFLDHKSDKLLLFSEDGTKSFIIPGLTSLGRFWNTSEIQLGIEPEVIGSNIRNHNVLDEFYVFSPDTGNLIRKSVPFPYAWGSFNERGSYQVYSPNSRYAIYTADYAGRLTNLLLNVGEKEPVKNKRGGYAFGDPVDWTDRPFWKPDSSVVTIVNWKGSHNFYNIETDGDFIQLTYLEQLLGKDYSLAHGYWSHSGRYLAFTAYVGPKRTLYILDAEKNILIDPCVSENPSESLNFFTPIFWSASGLQFAVGWGGKAEWIPIDPTRDNYKLIREEYPEILVLDLEHELIYQVPDKIMEQQNSLLGWITWEIP